MSPGHRQMAAVDAARPGTSGRMLVKRSGKMLTLNANYSLTLTPSENVGPNYNLFCCVDASF